jgi:GDP-4-dehydro-6-deoxy-D-mannose reductase
VRVFITGAIGFVGGWLQREFALAGHDVIAAPGPDVLDIADQPGVRRAVRDARPDAVIHLAAMAFAPDAAADAAEAIRVNVGGTHAIVEACRIEAPRSALLVVGSSEVYETPTSDAPLTETSPLDPRGVYGLTKLAAEALAISSAVDGLEVAVARSFNHTGPGQRPVFAVPAFARRILEARAAGVHEIHAGNVEVARDIGDVRDVARAYRLLVEALVVGRVRGGRRVFNVATGRAITMRAVIDQLAAIADWPVEIVLDPELVRVDDPRVIRGDATLLGELTGWRPEIPFPQTLADLLADAEEEAGARA